MNHFDPSLVNPFGSIDRRDFLRTSILAGATLSLTSLVGASIATPGGRGHAESSDTAPVADACILIWLRGGVPQTDTWDPKRFTPFRSGMRASELLGTCRSIPTAIDGVRFGEGLEQLASVMDRGTVVRTLVADSSDRFSAPSLRGTATHLDAELALFTGSSRAQSPLASSTASRVAARAPRGERHLPTSIWIGRESASSIGDSADHYMVPDPDACLAAVDAAGRSRGPEGDARAKAIADSRARAAFDLSAEAESVRNAYLPRGWDATTVDGRPISRDGRQFARGVLLARRLVEHGARVVQVEYPFRPFEGFDVHEHGARRIAALKREIDRPIAALVRDLESRGLLRRTLVVVASEFGRTVGTARGDDACMEDASGDGADLVLGSERAYGFHGHFNSCSAALLFGGGIAAGAVRGRSADRHPMVPVEAPLTMRELHATIRTRLGVGSSSDVATALL